MARSIWKGSINFGLVNVPVQLFSAIQDKSIHFHLMNKEGNCRLRQKLYCPDTKKEYDFSQTAKGFELAPDNYVILDKEELKKLKPEKGDTIDIVAFVDIKEIDPIYYQRPYYLGPEERGTKSYQLLLQTMKENHKVALAQFSMRQKGYLAVIRPLEDILCLETMHYADEIVEVKKIIPTEIKAKINEKEKKIAKQLLESMSEKFKPEKYYDEYTEQVKKLIKLKSSGKKIISQEPAVKSSGKVINLLDALKKSLEEKDKNKTKGKAAKVKHKPLRRSG